MCGEVKMSDMNELDEKIVDLLSVVFDVEREQINEQSNVDNLEKWDSINHMHLVVALEEEFGVEFEDDEAVSLISFELIRSYLKEKIEKYRDK